MALPNQNYAPGPRVGGQAGGRRRNTTMNLLSKQVKMTAPGLPGMTQGGGGGGGGSNPQQGAAPGGLTISQTLGLQGSLQDYTYNYLNALAQLRMSAAGARAGFAQAVPQIRTQTGQAISADEAAASDRGILNSSVDLKNRQTDRSNMSQAIVDARNQMTSALQQVALQRAQAQQQFQLGLLSVAQQRAGYQEQNSVDAFANNTLLNGNVTGQQFQALMQRFLRQFAGPPGTGAPTVHKVGS